MALGSPEKPDKNKPLPRSTGCRLCSFGSGPACLKTPEAPLRDPGAQHSALRPTSNLRTPFPPPPNSEAFSLVRKV